MMVKCPFCAEEIRSEAVKCRHCHAILDARAEPFSPTNRATSLRQYIAVLCFLCGFVLYTGSALAQMGAKDELRGRFLAMAVYNFVLGVSYIVTSAALTIGTKRCYLYAVYTSVIYIACTWTNELVQLIQGDQAHDLTDMGALFDILFWSSTPVYIIILCILAARLQQNEASERLSVRR